MYPDHEYDRELHLTARILADEALSKSSEHTGSSRFLIDTLSRAYLDLLERRGMPPDLKMHPSIQLRSGVFYDFLDPASTPIDPLDIAAGLSKNCRCTGQILPLEIYSVAQHCCHAHDMAPPSLKFKALMHDSPESVMNDMATPLKQLLVDYQVIEKRVSDAIADQFSLPHDFEDEVKHIDLRMAATEKRDIMPPGDWAAIAGIEPYDLKIIPWNAARAHDEWLYRFEKAYQDYLEMLEAAV